MILTFQVVQVVGFYLIKQVIHLAKIFLAQSDDDFVIGKCDSSFFIS